jgi:hypothetical protein
MAVFINKIRKAFRSATDSCHQVIGSDSVNKTGKKKGESLWLPFGLSV